MNTKNQLLIIVITAFFSLSLNFSAGTKDANKKDIRSERKEFITKTTEEKTKASMLISMTNSEVIAPTSSNEADSTAMRPYDLGTFHFFHFNRIKRLRKCVKNLCLFAKLLLIYTHIAVLIMELMHIIHH
jgi:hypothetical protein